MAQRKGGEADSYYNQPPPMQYPPQAANNGYQGDSNPKYQQPPPNYGQNFQNPASPPMVAGDGKQTFDQVFKLGMSLCTDFFLFRISFWIMRNVLVAGKGVSPSETSEPWSNVPISYYKMGDFPLFCFHICLRTHVLLTLVVLLIIVA